VARRSVRQLTPAERESAQWMLADGLEPKAVARRLGVDVRSLNGLLDSPVVSKLSDVERMELVCRNAWVQYDRSRALAHSFKAAIPEKLEPTDRQGNRYAESYRVQQLASDRHLRTYLEAAEKLAKLGGSDTTEGRVVEIPVPREQGDGVTDGSSGDDGTGD